MFCHFVWDDLRKVKVLIPECYGSMHQEDLSGCTCRDHPQTFKQFEKNEYNTKLKQMEDHIKSLTQENNTLIRILEKIHKK